MKTEFLSVGIDIGTATSSLVLSRIAVSDDSSFFTAPEFNITGRTVIYKSALYQTPFVQNPQNPFALIDAEALCRIAQEEFERAGVNSADVQTGAVIITGESARKANAARVLEVLSGMAGEFAAEAAGPELEALLAGEGSGAEEYSNGNNARAANIDIGGGTSNIAVFNRGEVEALSSLDIGGRLVRVNDNTITYISRSVQTIAQWKGITLEEGGPLCYAAVSKLIALCNAMAEVLEMALGLRKKEAVFYELITRGAADFVIGDPPGAMFFSGGVSEAVYGGIDDIHDKRRLFRYNDIGVLLGDAVRKSALCTKLMLVKGRETVFATVTGAGCRTLSLSGSTVFNRNTELPLKNIPVLKLSENEEAALFNQPPLSFHSTNSIDAAANAIATLAAKAKKFLEQRDEAMLCFAIKGDKALSFAKLKNAAKTLCGIAGLILIAVPLIIVIEEDNAKALGELISIENDSLSVLVLDSIRMGRNSFIDIGKPLCPGGVYPVVLKTLIF